LRRPGCFPWHTRGTPAQPDARHIGRPMFETAATLAKTM
jgi:hypothetical protein